MKQHSPARVDAVDGLRALAMTAVIAQHCGLLPFGWTGVWLFYVISGYVITRGFLADEYAGDGVAGRWGSFLWRRALRIVPVYVLYVALNALMLWSADGVARLGDVPYLLSFTYNWHMVFGFWPGSSHWSPFGHLWTLSVEQQFYLLFPLLVLLVPVRRQWPLTVALVLAGPLVRWAWSAFVAAGFDDAGHRAFTVYASSLCHFDAFLIGSLIARAEKPLAAAPDAGRRLWRFALGLAAIYSAAYVLVNHHLGATGSAVLHNVLSGVLWGQGREVWGYVVVDALAAALLVHVLRSGAGSRWLAWRPAAWVGRVSYGGYLFHVLVLWFIGQALGGKVREQAFGLRMAAFAIAWIVTVALASASFRWFEMPVARWGRRLGGRAAPRPAVAAAQEGMA